MSRSPYLAIKCDTPSCRRTLAVVDVMITDKAQLHCTPCDRWKRWNLKREQPLVDTVPTIEQVVGQGLGENMQAGNERHGLQPATE